MRQMSATPVLRTTEAHSSARLDPRVRVTLEVLLVAAVVVGLYLGRQVSYLLFHSTVEVFSVIIGVTVFMITWNTREYLDNNYLLFLGISLLFVAILDFVHLLAYTGMQIFPGYNADLATQLWIVARYMQALAFLIAPFFLGRKLNVWAVLGCYTAVEVALIALIFARTFPSMFVEGVGLTPAKNWSEYVICGILVVAIILLLRKRDAFEPRVMWLLIASMSVTMASELCFTFYKYAYSWPNFLGHIFKVVAFYLIYRAIIETGLRRPVDILFRNLSRSEEELRQRNAELQGFAYSVSHDLRGPLAAIGIAGSLAEEAAEQGTIDPADLAELSRTIDRSLEKSYALIDGLLAFAKAGQLPEQIEEVDVRETVDSIFQERADLISKKNVEVVVEDALGTVTMSPTHTYQVFSNLIGNAITHNNSPEPRVVISREEGEGGAVASRFTICDNGPGIPKNLSDSVFEPFVKGPGGGSGIGLATVAKIVGLYGGEITFNTNGGTCFEFELPSGATGTT